MKDELLFCPLGGSGEIGMNMNLFAYGKPSEHKWIMVDIGVTFADDTIPGIDLKKIKNVIGNDTISAVRSGFFWGYAGLIDNIINLIKKETRKSFKVIITGGFSDLFKNSIKTKVNHNKDITINGLIKISKLIK